ncbi:hypothetical protein [Planomonospora parontospora]|nr:hypothetical protein [Planomonospora parontospora]GGL45480.1 hypothetical protein GCM10014719_53450 [Planomonospora parontospora subsp. antibiotica]GII18628.1 hypothetical protein Ppa05_53540 [Planomonospora parontospora subsp. antibiotica]
MAEKTLSTARLAEAIRKAADPEPAAARPGIRPSTPLRESITPFPRSR